MMNLKYNFYMVVLSLIAFATGCMKDSVDFPSSLQLQVAIKTAGNPSKIYSIGASPAGRDYDMQADQQIPLAIKASVKELSSSCWRITLTIDATEQTSFYLAGRLLEKDFLYDDAYFLLPGFWYRKNLGSPEHAPSTLISRSWMVREDRLSIPLAGVYNTKSGSYQTICRIDKISEDALMPSKKGEVILHDRTDMGSLGFGDDNSQAMLTFSYPYMEAPYTYIRKLTLDPATIAFQHMSPGESRILTWEIRTGKCESYSKFIENIWNYSFDLFQPEEVMETMSDREIKAHLTDFFTQSFTDDYYLKGFSGVHLRTDQCEKRGILEVGFIGRVLLNAYNALEYGYEHEDEDMLRISHAVFDSYERDGFTANGFIREVIDFPEKYETDIYSIRRQSEGLYAILQYLSLEAYHNRMHANLNDHARILLNNIVSMQSDNYFPRKFTDRMEVVDPAGGSTSIAVIPLLMGWKHFGDAKYLEVARTAGKYLEEEIIRKGDYFSSTLDANCEDKEASIYASSAMYYLGLTADKDMQQHYFNMAEKAAYFALSWYYLWDVPFASGQMLGDLGFLTRGWGNVSVENNHVDVYIFNFADVLNQLSRLNGNERLARMAAVIKSSMREQLLPVEGRLNGIAKTGYYPEVVQHTNWDYGQFGKGYYNDIFAPGWTVASIWELLSENRLYDYFTVERVNNHDQ